MNELDFDDINVQNLEKLGLTPLQARIYIALLKEGKTKVLTVSKIVLADRSNVYRTILQLEKRGIVTKTLGTPSLYDAVTLKEAVSTLINSEKAQFDKMQKVAQELTQQESANEMRHQQSENDFVLIKMQRERSLMEMATCFKNVKESIDFLMNKKTLEAILFNLANIQSACLKRGVKIRTITENIKSIKTQNKLEEFTTQPNYHIRTVINSAQSEVGIFDRKVAYVNVVQYGAVGSANLLVTRQPGFIEICQNHFDTIWNEAQEYKLNRFKKSVTNKYIFL